MDGIDYFLGFGDVWQLVSWELFGVVVHVCFDIFERHGDRLLNFRQVLTWLFELGKRELEFGRLHQAFIRH
jgi:hypothetical protein